MRGQFVDARDGEKGASDVMMNEDEAIAIHEELSRLKLRKNDGVGMPTYSVIDSKAAQSAARYNLR